ncbi:MAG: DUF5916 domain-containing protein [Acidobacteriota bacterium]
MNLPLPPFRALPALLLLLAASLQAEQAPARLVVPRTTSPITIDGDLSDPGWQGAGVIDTFYETQPGDNVTPKVKTTALVTYDAKHFYIGVICDDPEPKKIRAPYVDRDNIIGTDDNVAIFLDTRNDRRSAIELRVNPRGIQADAMYNDADGNEDFSPDFFYDTAARITETGWSAEYRIPFSSLRYPKSPVQTWTILIWRNYPRDYRYFIMSSAVPRSSNCWICHSMELTGITDLPSGGYLVGAPYVAAKESGHPRNEPGSDFVYEPVDGEAGLDVKWTPTANTALDVALNPDFSQIESDVGQIAVNNRFALFYPEKRPFFLESVDLFDTPIQAVYTRTITSPKWGVRATGKTGSSAYTFLVAEDRGGGSVIIPGPDYSSLAPQDFRSFAAIGRVRRDFGRSFGGLLFTDREIEGGGHNRVFGPDFQWRPSSKDQLVGQILVSDTQTPDLPDLDPSWDGGQFTSSALSLMWLHSAPTWIWRLTYEDIGDGFRADNGFVPQVGYRLGRAYLGRNFYPEGVFRVVRPYFIVRYDSDRDGRMLLRRTFPGVQLQGWHNLVGMVEVYIKDKSRVEDQVFETSQVFYYVEIDPSRRFSRIGVSGYLGEDIDFANLRVGNGGELMLTGTIKPTDHLQLEFNADRQWLNVTTESGLEGRLFTAQIERIKATYSFTARALLRAIGEYLTVDRDPALYSFEVPARSGGFSGSLLLSYKLNWQTVFFIGYGDNRTLTEDNRLTPEDRQFFLKMSYAFQR